MLTDLCDSVQKFKDNREEWTCCGRLIENAVAAVIQSLCTQYSTEAVKATEGRIQQLLEALETIKTEIHTSHDATLLTRRRSLSGDRQLIGSLKNLVDAALAAFQLTIPETFAEAHPGQLLEMILNGYNDALNGEGSLAPNVPIQPPHALAARTRKYCPQHYNSHLHPPALAARTHHLLAQACPSARLRPCCQARVPASPHARRAYARSPAPCTPARSHVRTAPCPLPSLHAGSQASPRSSPPTSSQPRTAAPAYATQYAHSTCTRIAAGAHSCPHSSPSQLPARAPSTRVCLVLPAHASTHKRSRSPSQSTVLAAARTHSQPTARARTHPHPPVLVASSRPLHLHLPPAAFAATRASTRVVSCSPSAVILLWSRSLDHQNVFWLNGVAGSGKSAIAHTVAQVLQKDGLLGSSFFFNREYDSRNTSQMLISTIARDIAARYPAMAVDISTALESEPALASASLSRQFEAFIAQPLRRHKFNHSIVVVIDALDEVVQDDSAFPVLTMLRDKIAEFAPQLRILITSRPTMNIGLYLSTEEHIMSHTMAIDSVENREDIEAYVDAQLRDKSMASRMGSPWPDEALVRDLKVLADGLFIWIVTVFNYLRSVHKPRAKLRALLSKSDLKGVLGPNKKMDALYTVVLDICGDWEDPDFCEDYVILMLKYVLSPHLFVYITVQ
ncbi:hypothetical protein FIBSPDRAFT_960770 [Athelia psychrophila]|uniref:NACHT domain-containing protein n=1 Tax=Athelia psychrophila TaxID=1759441 RepID=A0A166C2Q3_9AGAM|nr:hypothetical protein FIBSPDRAFT_960770 [Fibularhizoctonia sp. CBS 109695]